MTRALIFTIVPLALTAQASIVNGDFESGNSGFFSEYQFAPNNLEEGQYTVRPDPQNWNAAFFAMPDHTSGSGSMMVVNGAKTPELVVWEQSVDVAPFTRYEFSAWVSTAVAGGPANLTVTIDDVAVGGSFLAPATPGTWVNWSATWVSGEATSATLRIFDINLAVFPNDFYLDDITFTVSVDQDGDGVDDASDNCTAVSNPTQRDTDSDGIGNSCDPDVATPNDCSVNFLDLNIYKANFFAAGDLDTDNDGDGITNFADLVVVKDYFFGPPGPSAFGCN